MAKDKHKNKAKETKSLIDFAIKSDLLVPTINETNFISEGAEQKVYIHNEQYVIKLNDAIYYDLGKIISITYYYTIIFLQIHHTNY